MELEWRLPIVRYLLSIVVILAAASSAQAQVQSRPAERPLVTAVDESWYVQREPVPFAGDLYYPAGAAVFFNGDNMVQSGSYSGVPLYVDTTLEPYSIIYVPISRGSMQPYERPRRGDLAGTTGSRAPSFPVGLVPGRMRDAVAASAVAPTALPQPIAAIDTRAAEPVAVGTTGRDDRNGGDTPGSVGTGGSTTTLPRQPTTVATLRRPESNDGVWLRFAGERWVHSGAAVALDGKSFVQVGDYAGFPVFARAGLHEDAIYLPTRDGILAPYRLQQ
jgi:hypothetical protein